MANWRMSSEGDEPEICQYHRPRLTALAVAACIFVFAVLVVLSTAPLQ